jgi:hypothetical protein
LNYVLHKATSLFPDNKFLVINIGLPHTKNRQGRAKAKFVAINIGLPHPKNRQGRAKA